MRIISYFLWSMVVFALAGVAYLYFFDNGVVQNQKQASVGKIGGEFNLIRQDGNAISDKDLKGKPHVIFFGFTNCPEVCPSTLFEISGWMEKMGADADQIGFYFMTVDPARDTAPFMQDYLSSFDPRIIGITGEKSKVEQTLKSFKVYFNRVDQDDGEYSMDHTATIYLLNSEGEFVGSIAYGEDEQSAVAKLKRLLS